MINNTLNRNKSTKVRNIENSFRNPFPGIPNRTPFQPPVENKTSFQPTSTTQPGQQIGLVSNTPKSNSSSLGTYKGVAINPGTQEQIQAQMRAIDSPIQSSPTSTLAVNTQTTTTPKITTPTTTPTPQKGLFPDIVSSLASKGTEPSKAVSDAQKAYLQSVENLKRFRESVADTRAGIFSDPVSARVMQGRDAALQQANAEKLAAYQGAVQETQTGVTQAQEQQSLEQQALQQAGALTQPVQAPYSSALYDPTTGQMVTQGGLGGYAGFNAAEQAQSLGAQYPDAGFVYNPSLSPQENLQNAQRAIQGSPTYQRSTFGAPGASTFLGGAGLQTAGKLQEDRANLEAQVGSAEANFDLMINVARRAGINKLDQPILNTLKSAAERGLVSNEEVVSFQSMIESVRAQYATILAGGGVPTDAVRSEAQRLIPNDVSISALETLGGNLAIEAGNRIIGLEEQINLLSGSQIGSQGGVIKWEDL